MLYQTTQEHEALRAKVREFAEAEIKPIAFMLDKNNQFPTEQVKKMGELGLMGLPYEKEYGGAGLDALSYATLMSSTRQKFGKYPKPQITQPLTERLRGALDICFEQNCGNRRRSYGESNQDMISRK